MKPTPALILKGISKIANAKIPPIADSGIAEKISNPCLIDLNAKYNKKKISNKATGTATDRRALASSRFLKEPP